MNGIFPTKDAELITGILNRAFVTVARTYGYTPELVPEFPAFIKPAVIAEQIRAGLIMYVYQQGECASGCGGYSLGEGRYIIERLGVLPEYRHRGIGRALLDFMEKNITGAGGRIAEASIVDNNEILKTWYKALGYREIKTETYIHLPFKACVLQKEL